MSNVTCINVHEFVKMIEYVALVYKSMNKQIGVDQRLARKYNSATILDHLRLHAPVSRAGLAEYTGLTRSTVSRIIDQLQAENLVHEVGSRQDKVGRPGTLIELNPSGGIAVGVEIGVDFVSVILTNFVAQILWREHINLPECSHLGSGWGYGDWWISKKGRFVLRQTLNGVTFRSRNYGKAVLG